MLLNLNKSVALKGRSTLILTTVNFEGEIEVGEMRLPRDLRAPPGWLDVIRLPLTHHHLVQFLVRMNHCSLFSPWSLLENVAVRATNQ